MSTQNIHGSIPALITPFTKEGVDWSGLDRLLEWHIEQGSHGLVLCGTTGESPTQSLEEHAEIIEHSVPLVKDRITVIVGTGSNNTADAISLTKAAETSGAHAALIITPYYNKPTQDGLYAHFKAIHDATDIPIIMYNVPGRTGVDISNETVARLSKLERIIGIKDASNDLARPQIMRRDCCDGFILLSGEDPTCAGYYAMGGQGCISVTANVAPALCAEQYNSWARRDIDTFMEIQSKLSPLHEALFFETSPSPVKYAVGKLGFCSDYVRPPLVVASETCRKIVDAAMLHAGIDP